MTLCPPVSWLLLVHPTPSTATLLLFLSFPHLHLLLSEHLFRSSLPGCRVPLHINRTLVTAFSASSCLLSPSHCSISTIMCLHTPTFLTVASSSHPVLSICLCLPFLHRFHLYRFVLPVFCPSVLTTYGICHQNPPSPSSSSILPPSPPSLPFPRSYFPTLHLPFAESLKLHLLPVPL